MADTQGNLFNHLTVAMALREMGEFNQIRGELSRLMLYMGTSDTKRHEIYENLSTRKKDLLEALLDLLVDWKTKNPKEASCPKLIEIFRKCELNLHADVLDKLVSAQSDSTGANSGNSKSSAEYDQVQENKENGKIHSSGYHNEENDIRQESKSLDLSTKQSSHAEQSLGVKSNSSGSTVNHDKLETSSQIQCSDSQPELNLLNESTILAPGKKQEPSGKIQHPMEDFAASRETLKTPVSAGNDKYALDCSQIKTEDTESKLSLTKENLNDTTSESQSLSRERNDLTKPIQFATSALVPNVFAIAIPGKINDNILDSKEAIWHYKCTMIFSALLPILLSLLIPGICGLYVLTNQNSNNNRSQTNSSLFSSGGTNITDSPPVFYTSDQSNPTETAFTNTSPATSFTELVPSDSEPIDSHAYSGDNSLLIVSSPRGTDALVYSDGVTNFGNDELPAVHASEESYLSKTGLTNTYSATSFTELVLNVSESTEGHSHTTENLIIFSPAAKQESTLAIDPFKIVVTGNMNTYSLINISNDFPALTELIFDNSNDSLCNGTLEQYVPECPAKFFNLLVFKMYNIANCTSIIKAIIHCMEASKLQNFVFEGEVQEESVLQLFKLLNRSSKALQSVSISGILQTNVSLFYFYRETVFVHLTNFLLDLTRNTSSYLGSLNIVHEEFCHYFPQVEKIKISGDLVLGIYQYKTLLHCTHLKYIDIVVAVHDPEQINDIMSLQYFSKSLLEFRLTVSVANSTLCDEFNKICGKSKWLQSVKTKKLCCLDYSFEIPIHTCVFGTYKHMSQTVHVITG